MSNLLSIDLSMRSAGLVVLDESGALVDQLLIPTKKDEYDNEFLLEYMEDRVLDFADKHRPNSIVIEGMAFNSKSGKTDLIAGNWWNTRKELRQLLPDANIGSIPVLSWRSKTIDLKKGNKAVLQEQYGKTYLKDAVRDAVPKDVLATFTEYLAEFNWPKSYPAGKKREAIYDLCDAYCMGIHRLNIGSL